MQKQDFETEHKMAVICSGAMSESSRNLWRGFVSRPAVNVGGLILAVPTKNGKIVLADIWRVKIKFIYKTYEMGWSCGTQHEWLPRLGVPELISSTKKITFLHLLTAYHIFWSGLGIRRRIQTYLRFLPDYFYISLAFRINLTHRRAFTGLSMKNCFEQNIEQHYIFITGIYTIIYICDIKHCKAVFFSLFWGFISHHVAAFVLTLPIKPTLSSLIFSGEFCRRN